MKSRNKKSVKLTDAIVRGEKNAYEFEVFPIATEFESQPAVYIFSRRKIDKIGRGHQKFVCIGQTPSLDGDFSKYKKKYAAKVDANVICVYIEENESRRLKIEEELKAAHVISCATNSEPKPSEIKSVKPVKISETKRQESVRPERQISKMEISKLKDVKKKPKSDNLPIAAKTENKKSKNLPAKGKTSKSKPKNPSLKVKNQKLKVKTAKTNGKDLQLKTVKTKSNNQNLPKTKNKPQSNGKNAKSNGKVLKTDGKSLKPNSKTSGKSSQSVNSSRTAAKKVTGNKNRGSKQSSRKQLAF